MGFKAWTQPLGLHRAWFYLLNQLLVSPQIKYSNRGQTVQRWADLMHMCWGGGKHWQSFYSITMPFSFCKSQSYIVYIISLQHNNLTSKKRSSMVFLVWWHVVCVVYSEPRLCSGWVMNRPQIPQTPCTWGSWFYTFRSLYHCSILYLLWFKQLCSGK